MTSTSGTRDVDALIKGEALMVANQYIGTDGGYFGRYDRPGGRFSCRTIAEFYPQYCGVEVDLNLYPGTSRETFVAVLHSRPMTDQIKILKGVFELFPPGDDSERASVLPEIHGLIKRLEQRPLIVGGDLRISSAAVRGAIQDAEILLREQGPERTIDRVHTALHAYLRAVCDAESIEYPDLASVQGLLKKLEREHPKLANLGSRPQELTTILNALGTIAGALDPIRNNASPAHANLDLLGEAEAFLVINTVRALYFYLDAKLG